MGFFCFFYKKKKRISLLLFSSCFDSIFDNVPRKLKVMKMQQRRRPLPRMVSNIKSRPKQMSEHVCWVVMCLCCIGLEVEAEGNSLMDQLRGEALKFHKPGKEVKVNSCSL